MHFARVCAVVGQLALLSIFLIHVCSAAPVQDWNQRRLKGPHSGPHGGKPFTRKHRDQYDHKIDTVGNGMQPLPFRNGDGASMLGPRNKARERQNPDMLRPP